MVENCYKEGEMISSNDSERTCFLLINTMKIVGKLSEWGRKIKKKIFPYVYFYCNSKWQYNS